MITALSLLALSACTEDDPTSTPDTNQATNNTSANNTSAENNTSPTNNTTPSNNTTPANNTAGNTAPNNTTSVECTEDAQCDDQDPCTVNTCSGEGVCVTDNADDGTTCDDGDLCTQADTCQAGVCAGADPVVCEASDQCHDAGVCDPATGMCSDPALPDDTACDDGDLCTQADTCQAGVCTGADPVVCTASDQCHGVGVCDSATGTCSDPALPDDTACDDGDLCTQADTCQAGACTGADPVVCTASDQCHGAGVCDPTSGVCSDPPVQDGTVCDDGDACTQTDACQAGACQGANPVVCTASDQCHDVGVCDPASGVCSDPPAQDGTLCDDGDLCSENDQCLAGSCQATPVMCTAAGSCFDVGTCDASTGVCSDPLKPDGTMCNTSGTCSMGSCEQIIAKQDFEVTPSAPVWTYTGSPNFMEGFSSANATPANSPLGIGGSRAWELTQVGGGLPLTFANQQIPTGSASRLQFKLAAMSLNFSSGGPDNLDYVLVEISTDGGATFYPRVRIRGASNNNSTWSYNAATTVSVPHLPMTEETFQPTNSGLQETDGISTVEITFPDTVTQVAVRITMRSSSSSDTWLLDNLTLYAE